MNKILKRITILAGIFLVAVGVYFITSLNRMNQSETVYTAMEAPTLPVVYTDLFGMEKNRLIGYRQEMDSDVVRDFLTVLPEDRQLKLYLEGYGVSLYNICYEIRSLDMEQLVERTEVETWSTGKEEDTIILPIQNLLVAGCEYILHITLETEQHGSIHYYTRILYPENDYGQPMVELARSFSTKTLSGRQAADLVTYLDSG